MAFAAGPALAAEPGGGMPQLDPTWFPSQLFWLVVSFLVLYALVSGLIHPRVRSVLTAREKAITDAIALAEELKRDAAATKGNFEQQGSEARAQAAQIVATAQAAAAKESAEAHATLSGEIEARAAESHKQVAKAVERAGGQLEAAALPLAQEISEKLIGRKVDAQAVRAAIGNLLKAA
ncbi:MAG: hypothetical protein WDN72_03165 [Alphaproteobacteria bacterium]